MTLNPQKLPSLWKVASDCSEAQIEALATLLANQLKARDRVMLEGPLGAGKTTFTRYLLKALKIIQAPEGSPTFALVHEYQAPIGEVAHIDFYRIRSETEIDDAGIPSYYWERDLLVISEWLSAWPDFECKVLKSGRAWKIKIDFDPHNSSRRTVNITTNISTIDPI